MSSPLQGGTRRRPRRRRFTPAVIVLLLLGAAAAAVAVIDGGSSGGSKRKAALGRTAPSPNPNRRLRHGKLPIQAPPGLAVTGPNVVDVHLKPKPAAAMLYDLDRNRVLWKLHPLRVRPIASVTKVMTALIVAEQLPYDATSLIKKEAVKYTGSMVGLLPRGKRVPVQTLLYGAMLPSGNDAATALADRVAGSDRKFARLMNRRARRLGLSCTHFVSAYGLQPGNRSCVADLAVLTRLAMRQPRIAHVVRHRRVDVKFPFVKGKRLTLYTTNPLLKLRYPGAIGLKTGTTDPAGHCFIGVARRDGHTLAAILLKSPDIGGQAVQLLNAGFAALRAAG